MRCYVTGKAKTTANMIAIDFIEARRGEELFVLDWDETELGFDTDCDEHGFKKFSGRLKGIKFNDQYANGKIDEIRGAQLSDVQFYIPDGTNTVKDISFDSVQLDDEGDLYDFCVDNPYENIIYTICHE